MNILKRILEVSTLLTLVLAMYVININSYKKIEEDTKEKKVIATINYEKAKNNIDEITAVTFDEYLDNKMQIEKQKRDQEYQEYLASLVVYDGLTMNELAEKLERSLKNELSGYGYLYASYSLEKGVDPYIAVAISLHETGCNGHCSNLMRECNNVGGQKGYPRCGDRSYKQFDTLEEGIKGFIDNLSKNYFGMGLDTPELMEKKYAAGSDSWAGKVNYYVQKIRER